MTSCDRRNCLFRSYLRQLLRQSRILARLIYPMGNNAQQFIGSLQRVPFSLPPNWYLDTVRELVTVHLPKKLGTLSPQTAWRYVYAIVLWSQLHDGARYVHIQESDKLKSARGRELADRAAEYLRQNLASDGRCDDPFALIDQIGIARNRERVAQGLKADKPGDPNVTGTAFETVLQVVIEQLCGVLPARQPQLNKLRGFELAPVAYHSRPDLALFGQRDFRLLISTKWTLRKERIGTYLHEAYFYKQRRPDLQVAFVLSEYQTNVLHWLANDVLVDRVYHVNKEMFLQVHAPFAGRALGESVSYETLLGHGREVKAYRRWLELSERVFDLSDLFQDISMLAADDGPEGTSSTVEDSSDDAAGEDVD